MAIHFQEFIGWLPRIITICWVPIQTFLTNTYDKVGVSLYKPNERKSNCLYRHTPQFYFTTVSSQLSHEFIYLFSCFPPDPLNLEVALSFGLCAYTLSNSSPQKASKKFGYTQHSQQIITTCFSPPSKNNQTNRTPLCEYWNVICHRLEVNILEYVSLYCSVWKTKFTTPRPFCRP